MKKIVLAVVGVFSVFTSLNAQTTAFTYQGRLNDNGAPATGVYDLRFTVYDMVTDGNAVSSVLTNSLTDVSGGLFTVKLDFGTNVFNGTPRWIEIGVRTNGDTNPYATLNPRLEVTSAPYAITAQNVSGTISDAQLSTNVARLDANQTFTGAVSFNSPAGFNVGSTNKVTNLNADLLDGLDSSAFAKLNTSPSFTGDILAPRLKIGEFHNLSGLRASIAGGYVNTVSSQDSFIGGGLLNTIDGNSSDSFIGGGGFNKVINAPHSAISGGYLHVISNAQFGAIAGGLGNRLETGAGNSSIGGGYQNVISSNSQISHIGGGQVNLVGANVIGGIIVGGNANTNKAPFYATIGGGQLNLIEGANESTIVGGRNNTISEGAYAGSISGNYNSIGSNSHSSTISGGTYGSIGTNSPYSFIGGGTGNIISSNSLLSTVAGGVGNSISNQYATIAGGLYNKVTGIVGTIGGGQYNINSGNTAFIGGGAFNTVSGSVAGVLSGSGNIAAGDSSSVVGGQYNTAAGAYSMASGRRAKANHDGTFVWADSQDADFSSTATNQFLVRASGGVGVNTTPVGGFHVLSSVAFNTGIFESTNGTGTWLNLRNSTNGHWGLIASGSANSEGAGQLLIRDNAAGLVRMTIKTNGNVGIGTTNPGFMLEVNGTAGKPGGGSWTSTSDARLKKNIRPLAGALRKLLALRGVTFEYIDPAKIHELSGERMGVIAQEVEKVFPDWVETGADGYKRVTVRGLEALVVEAVRELKAEQDEKISQLQEKAAHVASLEKRVAELERKDAERDARMAVIEAAVAGQQQKLIQAKLKTTAAD